MENYTKIKNTIDYFTSRGWVFSLRDLSAYFILTESFAITEEEIEAFLPDNYVGSIRIIKRLEVEKCYHPKKYNKKLTKYYIYNYIKQCPNKKASVVLNLLHGKINKAIR
jgi:hypothetical protein